MLTPSELHKLAFDFFQTFARFEYALKSSGHFKKTSEIKNGKPKTIDAQAYWPAFSLKVQLTDLTSQSEEIKQAVDFLFEFPPKKQVIEENCRLEWDPATPTGGATSSNLFSYIGRVRNNLFHGGKFNANNDWLDPVRSEKLIRASLLILNASISIVPEVETVFKN